MSAPLFERATASKALALTTMVCSGAAIYLNLQMEGIGPKKLALKNILASQFIFRKFIPEMIFGLGLLYVFRHIEREIGTRKFFSFCFVSSTVSLSLQLILLLSTEIVDENKTLTSGPLSPIFSLLVLYFAHVPAVSAPYFGVYLNNKLPVYGVALFLAFFEGKFSFIPSVCGLIGGLLAYSQFKKLYIPDSIARFGTNYIEPIFKSANPSLNFPYQQQRRPVGFGQRYQGYGGVDAEEDEVLLPNFFGPPHQMLL